MRSLFIVLMTFVSVVAFGQISAEVPSPAEWNVLFGSLVGIGGLKAAGLIALGVQILMLIVRQFVQGKWKLAIVAGLTLLGSIAGALIEGGGGIGSIFTNALVITSVQVLFNQILVQSKKPN